MGSARATVVEFIKAKMAEPEAGPLAIWTSCRDKLKELKVGRNERIPPHLMLVSSKNRGGAGVNCFNSHKNLLRISKVGADLELLTQAACVEMPPQDSELYATEMACNQAWVEASQGMLAPITGEERFLSLATSHTMAGCRAARAGCVTPYHGLKSEASGCIDVAMLCKNTNMATMINDGWLFFVIPWWLEKECPGFLHIVQKALNAHHNMVTKPNEVEAAASMLEEMLLGGTWESAEASLMAAEIPCKEYLCAIAKLIQLNGGPSDRGYPYIQLIKTFSQSLGLSIMLGQDFTVTLANSEDTSSCDYSFTKMALWLTQLSSTDKKVQDGYGKLVTVADVTALIKSSNKAGLRKSTEATLEKSWRLSEDAKSAKTVSENNRVSSLGLCWIRVILHILKKEKWGIDDTEYDSLDHIVDLFQAGIGVAKPAQAEPSKADGPDKSSDAADKPAEGSKAAVAMRKMNLKIGKYYKKDEDIFKLDKVTEEEAYFSLWSVFGTSDVVFRIPLENSQDLKKFKLNTSKLQQQQLVELKNCSPSNNPHIKAELVKCNAFQTLSQALNTQEAYEEPEHENKFHFTANPAQLFAGTDFNKGELILVPMTDSPNKLSTEIPKESELPVIKVEGHSFCINPPASNRHLKALASGDLSMEKFEKAKHPVMPFWYVTKAGKEQTSNMVASTVDIGMVKVPCLKNSKPIKKHELILKPGDAPKKKARLSK